MFASSHPSGLLSHALSVRRLMRIEISLLFVISVLSAFLFPFPGGPVVEVAHYNHTSSRLHCYQSLVVYATAKGIIRAWDLRAPGEAWSHTVSPRSLSLLVSLLVSKQDRQKFRSCSYTEISSFLVCSAGPISSFFIEPRHNWMVVSTSRGVYTCLDARFNLAVKSWNHPAASPHNSIARVKQYSLMGGPDRKPWFWAAVGANELWVALSARIRIYL